MLLEDAPDDSGGGGGGGGGKGSKARKGKDGGKDGMWGRAMSLLQRRDGDGRNESAAGLEDNTKIHIFRRAAPSAIRARPSP